MKFIIITLSVLALWQWSSTEAYPLHASCRLTWTWPSTSCQTVHQRLVKQIDLWKDRSNCPNSEHQRCLYTLVKESDAEIIAYHTTPVKLYIDDMTISLSPKGDGCQIKVRNSSYSLLKFVIFLTYLQIISRDTQHRVFGMPSWIRALTTAILTTSWQVWSSSKFYLIQYWHIFNILCFKGAELHKESGFVEETSDSICTQYSSRNCDKY